MNEEKLKSLSTKDLIKKAKNTKQATGILAGIIFVLYVVTIYSSIRDREFDTMMIVAIAFTFTVVSNFRQVRKMEDEIRIRELE